VQIHFHIYLSVEKAGKKKKHVCFFYSPIPYCLVPIKQLLFSKWLFRVTKCDLWKLISLLSLCFTLRVAKYNLYTRRLRYIVRSTIRTLFVISHHGVKGVTPKSSWSKCQEVGFALSILLVMILLFTLFYKKQIQKLIL